MRLPLAIYIHIPFCTVRCPYCDFNTYAGLEGSFAAYAEALEREIRRAGDAGERPPVRTIFIGGGTPTVLPSALLERILTACREAFAVLPGAEITSEANPGTVDQVRFRALHDMGVNRLSMGVQSFDDAELRWLGRIHSAGEAEEAFGAARSAGFENINLDFMFGLPSQSPDTWRRTLARALALSPEHLSLYSLTVEEGTPLADSVRRGLVPDTDDDLAADLYQAATETLAGAGYVQYEISNWARGTRDQGIGTRDQEKAENERRAANSDKRLATREEGLVTRDQEMANGDERLAIREGEPVTRDRDLVTGDTPWSIRNPQSAIGNPLFACRHNLVYWRHEPYWGFGAGAHSYDGGRRWWNVKPVPKYVKLISEGRPPEGGSELIDDRLAKGETMMLGLRLVIEGVDALRFRRRFGTSLEEEFGREIGALAERGLLERLPDRVRLTPGGRLLGNQVFAAFLP